MDFTLLTESALNFASLVFAILIGITVHEAAHAWVAYKLGDPTAKLEGRITLNPLSHLDPIGTISLFLMHMGWGKPVPYNPNNFKYPTRDAILTALAGPFANLLTAMLFMVATKHIFMPMNMGVGFLMGIIQINVFLMIFNLLPIPPLDGSKLLLIIFARDKFKHLLDYSYIPALIFVVLIGIENIFHIPTLSLLIGPVASTLLTLLFMIS